MDNKNVILPVNILADGLAITQLLRNSFIGIANEMGIIEDENPNYVAFIARERLIEQLYNENAYFFGIQKNSMWIGFVAVAPYGDTYEITRLAVAPEHRHKGYGRALMDAACGKARDLGLTSIGLGTLYENKVLVKWYEAQGFVAGEPFIPTGASYAVCGMSKEL